MAGLVARQVRNTKDREQFTHLHELSVKPYTKTGDGRLSDNLRRIKNPPLVG